jgi:ubiquitin-conjugating enzyme E2 A
MAINLTNIRLSRELARLQSDNLDDIISVVPINDYCWHAKIKGPVNTPFENGVFDIQLTFDSDYPIKAPSVKFLTPMFHPNIYRDGKICIDILQSKEWTPALNVRTILMSIISLLMDPNPASPANRDAAELYKNDKITYESRVKDFIKTNTTNTKK